MSGFCIFSPEPTGWTRGSKSVLRFKDPRGPLADEQEELVERIATEFHDRPAAMALHFHGDDPEAQETIAARIARRFGRHLFVLRMEDAPTVGADLEEFLALWRRETLILPAFLLLGVAQRDAEPQRADLG